MNKQQLKNFLDSHFEMVIENKNNKDLIETNKIHLGIDVNSIDNKCYIWVADYVVKNNKSEYFYFLYHSKKDTTIFYDEIKKNICIRLSNNVTQRYKYELFLKKVKKFLPSSKTYVVFYTNGKVIYNDKNNKNHIFICNDETIEKALARYYDF